MTKTSKRGDRKQMKIRIFQVDRNKDEHSICFMSHDFAQAHGGISADVYTQIYGGTVQAETLEDVFALGNTKPPPGYYGRSVSVSDVIEICEGDNKGFYYVDSMGFKQLGDFDIAKTDHTDMMKILVLENNKPPYVAEIRHDISAMQSVVGGCIEPIYFEPKGDAICWCNDEFLLHDFAPNRVIGNTIVHGTCYISGDGVNEDGEYDSCSLTDEQIEKYANMFRLWLVPIMDIMDITEDESEDIGQNLT